MDINNAKNRNYENVPTITTIYDMRDQEHNTHIDKTGFQALTSPSSISSDLLLSGNDKEIEKIYYPEVEALLLKHTGIYPSIKYNNIFWNNVLCNIFFM